MEVTPSSPYGSNQAELSVVDELDQIEVQKQLNDAWHHNLANVFSGPEPLNVPTKQRRSVGRTAINGTQNK